MKIRSGNKKSHGMRCYASGGRVAEDISDAGSMPAMNSSMDDEMGGIDGGPARPRLDRAAKKPSSNTINIVVTSSKPEAAAPPMGLPQPPPPMAGPPMPPPVGMPPMPMRKDGGRVNKTWGEAIGDKAKDYGKFATDTAKLSGKLLKGAATMSPQTGALAVRGAIDPNGVGADMKRGAFKAETRRLNEEKDKPERASGGRVSMDGGAGGGKGRLEKGKDYGLKPETGK